MRTQPYADRYEAGRELGAILSGRVAGGEASVLALPRGGVPVGVGVARALDAALDVLVVRKLGHPAHAELAMGAIAGVGSDVEVVCNQRVLAGSDVDAATFGAVYARELAELERREAAYRRPGRPRAPVAGRTAVLVDDGIATGSTMLAAVRAVRAQQPRRILVAVPVAAADAAALVGGECDELVCGWSPVPFHAVGQGYDDFGEVSDGEVRRLLAEPA